MTIHLPWDLRIADSIKRARDGVDRLSSLPDELLVTILSLLDTRKMIQQTCVLSKRWLNLWTLVPHLGFFNYCDHFNKITMRCEGRDFERFKNFVNSVLRLRDGATDVHTFRLWHNFSPDSMSWICYALRHNVKNLEIGLFLGDCFELSDCLFTCESLEDLDLTLKFDGEDKELIIPDNVFLPKLKKLRIECTRVGGNWLVKLLSGCPVLESLTLEECDVEMKNDISLYNVKKLNMRASSISNEVATSTCYISLPCVEYLVFDGGLESATKLKDISKIKKAELRFNQEDECYYCDFLSSLSGVENLVICYYEAWKDVLEGELPKCAMFRNLKTLELECVCMYCDIEPLSIFLHHCPNLKVLTLYHSEARCWQETHENLKDIKRLIGGEYSLHDLDLNRLARLLVQSTVATENVQIILRKF